MECAKIFQKRSYLNWFLRMCIISLMYRDVGGFLRLLENVSRQNAKKVWVFGEIKINLHGGNVTY